MAVETEILFGGNNSRSRRLPGGGPLEKPIVFWETSRCKEFVTASAGIAGGAVSHPRTFIASILSGPVIRLGRLKLNFQNPGLAHPLHAGFFPNRLRRGLSSRNGSSGRSSPCPEPET